MNEYMASSLVTAAERLEEKEMQGLSAEQILLLEKAEINEVLQSTPKASFSNEKNAFDEGMVLEEEQKMVVEVLSKATENSI
jgi:hypothetical protein